MVESNRVFEYLFWVGCAASFNPRARRTDRRADPRRIEEPLSFKVYTFTSIAKPLVGAHRRQVIGGRRLIPADAMHVFDQRDSALCLQFSSSYPHRFDNDSVIVAV